MLTRLEVRGYKALHELSIAFEPLTVIVGPNGCGKTSVLEAIAMVRDFVVKSHKEANESHPLAELRSKGVDGVPSIELWAQHEPRTRARSEEPDDAETAAQPSSSGSLRAGELHVALRGTSQWKRYYDARADPLLSRDLMQDLIESYFGGVRRLELDTKALARPSYLREVAPTMEADGSGLATVLSTLFGEQRDELEVIEAQLREFVPEFERIRFRPAAISIVEAQEVPVALDDDGKEILGKRRYRREVIGSEILFDFRHAKGVPAKHASEGTLQLLGLLTEAIIGRAAVLLLDDVDRALHPKAQQQLVTQLRKLTERGVQVIATTHSPYLVLHLEYDEVRAMMMSDAGGALIGKLTDHPEYERWRDNMTPSEFWTVFGEEWLVKAKAEAQGHG
jgi:predicted ATPase